MIRTGSTAHGQGHATTFAQIAADELGVDPDDVEVRAGDTAEIPEGVGTFGSRSVTIGGAAVLQACREVRERARGVGDGSMSVREAAAAAGGLDASVRFEISGPVFPFGAYVATVEIDPGSGVVTVGRIVAVDDPGRVMNPMLAEGQVVGSTVHGLGEALSEEVVHDAEGQMLTGSFTQYGILGAREVPPIESELQETPSPLTPLGAKGIGESGAIAVPAAVANAVADALSPFGVTHVDLPCTPERVWRAIRDATAG